MERKNRKNPLKFHQNLNLQLKNISKWQEVRPNSKLTTAFIAISMAANKIQWINATLKIISWKAVEKDFVNGTVGRN